MNNEELVQKAIEAGFDTQRCSRVTAGDGKEAVQLPRDTAALSKLEKSVPTLKSVSDEYLSFWLVRA